MTLTAILYSFLDDLDRIATPFYEPSDEHILRARLRTLGVQESVFSGNYFPLYIYNNLQDLCADGWAVRRLRVRLQMGHTIHRWRSHFRMSLVHFSSDFTLIVLVSAISLASLCRKC